MLFDEFALHLSDEQYRDMQYLLMHFNRLIRSQQYRAYRPPKDITPKTNPTAFWKFAINAVMASIHERNYKWSWSYFADRRNSRQMYIKLWTAKLSASQGKMTPDDQALLDKLEERLSYEDIRFYRSLAEVRWRKEKAKGKKAKDTKATGVADTAKEKESAPPTSPPAASGWFGWWYGSSSAATAATPTTDNKALGAALSLSDEQRKSILDAIDFDESDALADVHLPDSASKFKVDFELSTGRIMLRRARASSSEESQIELVFKTLSASYLQRPKSMLTEIELADMSLLDNITAHSLYPVIIRSKEDKSNVSTESIHSAVEQEEKTGVVSGPLFRMVYEHRPLSGKADSAIDLKMRPLEIVYVKETVDAVMDFLSPQIDAAAIDSLRIAAATFGANLKEISKAGLQFALQEHKTVDLKIDIEAPIFIFPEK